MVVGSRRDNRELYAITVHDNEVDVEMLWPGVNQSLNDRPAACSASRVEVVQFQHSTLADSGDLRGVRAGDQDS